MGDLIDDSHMIVFTSLKRSSCICSCQLSSQRSRSLFLGTTLSITMSTLASLVSAGSTPSSESQRRTAFWVWQNTLLSASGSPSISSPSLRTSWLLLFWGRFPSLSTHPISINTYFFHEPFQGTLNELLHQLAFPIQRSLFLIYHSHDPTALFIDILLYCFKLLSLSWGRKQKSTLLQLQCTINDLSLYFAILLTHLMKNRCFFLDWGVDLLNILMSI